MRVLLFQGVQKLFRLRLSVVLVTVVAMVAGGVVTPAAALPPASNPTSPANWSYVRTATPKLTGTVVSGVTYNFSVELYGGTPVVLSGIISSNEWAVPDGHLLDGKTYQWRIGTSDDGGNTWTNSAWSYFTVDLRAGIQPALPVDAAGPVEVNLATGNALYRHGSSPRLGTVGGPLGLNLSYNSLVAGAKAPTTRVLPPGWNSAVVVSDQLRYVAADTQVPGGVSFYGPNGEAYHYEESGPGSRSFDRPRNDDATVTLDDTGKYVVHGADGIVYVFDAGGVLSSATRATDRPNRSSPVYSSARPISSVTDPVTNRVINLRYGGGSCPTPPSGFDAAPAGYLCEAAYWDGTSTKLFYQSGRLARIEDPGSAITQFTYDGSSGAWRLWKIRDVRASDAVTAGQRADNDTVRTVIAYHADGKVATVTLPGQTATAARTTRSYSYGTTWAEADVSGLNPPSGYARRVTFWDTTTSFGGQITSDIDATGKTTTFSWHASFEAPASVVDPAGMKTTWAYSTYTRAPTDMYGPAAQGCFTGNVPTNPPPTTPVNCSVNPVPRTRLAYDGASTFSDGTATGSAAITGPAVTYWSNVDLIGDPVGFATGVGNPNGYLDANWGTAAPHTSLGSQTDNWSARFEGYVYLSAGDTNFRITSDDGVRMWINDDLYLSGWTDGLATREASEPYYTNSAGWHHIRVDYYEVSGPASIKLEVDPPGGQSWVPISVRPGYGLNTATADPDGKYSTVEYVGPETRLVTATVADPSGLNLRTITSYESSPGVLDPYKRPRSRTLPGASSSSTYTYYASGDTVPSSGCPGVSLQTGFAKQYTGQGGTPVQTRTLVDSRGRVVASQHVGDAAWNCTSYDSRGRVTTADDHQGGSLASNDYSVANQVTTTSTDSFGRKRTTITKWDILGRVTSYQDEHGTITTRTYNDQPGRLTATLRQLPGGSLVQLTGHAYDDAGRPTQLTEYASGTGRTTTFGYDAAGRSSSTTRPNNTVTVTNYEPHRGRIDEVEHKTTSGTILAETLYDRLPSGAVSWEHADVPNARPFIQRSFTYDGANRLTSVVEDPEDAAATTRWYRYDSRSNRCSTSSTVTNCSDTAYEYNSADQLTQSPFASSYDWDDQSNRPGRLDDTFGANGHPSMNYDYDARDHTTVIDDGSAKVEETLGSSGRVLRRKVTDTVPSPDVITEDIVYGYADGSDSPAYTRDLFTDDWNTKTGTATTWNASSWNADSNTTAKKIEVQGNEGAIWVSSSSTSARAATKMRQNSEVRLDYRFASSSASSELRVGLRSTGTSNPNNASYRVDINPTSSTIRLRKKVWGASSAVQLTSFTYSANTNSTPDKLRFRATNDANGDVLIQVKLWEGSTEPGTWNLQYTDSTTDKIAGAGTVELAHSSSSATNTAYIDNLTFSAASPVTTTDIRGHDGLLVTDSAGTPSYQLTNARGDIVGTTDSSGTFTAQPATDEFGVISGNGAQPSRLGWLGGNQRYTVYAYSVDTDPTTTDSKTQHFRMGERIYDPNVGRFTSTDPVEAGSLNAYEYGGADPINNCDLDGRGIIDCETILAGDLIICSNDYAACLRGEFGVWSPSQCLSVARACIADAFARYRRCRFPGGQPSGAPGFAPGWDAAPDALPAAAGAAAAAAMARRLVGGGGGGVRFPRYTY